MTSRLNFITGLALLIVAATVAATISLSNPPEARRGEARGPEAGRGVVPAKGGDPAGGDRRPAPGVFSVTVPADDRSHAELREQAAMVESEARHRLERLTEQLNLTGEQRRIIFPILARTVDGYESSMLVMGSPVGSAPLTKPAGQKEVERALEPGQKDQLIEETLNEQALWKEIIAQLQKELETRTPPGRETAAPEPPAGPRHQRRNLRDVMETDR